VDTALTDAQLTARLAEKGIRVRALSEYFHDKPEDRHCLVVNYSGLKEETLQASLDILENVM
jgi:DNA-binding transcriptional MocR family regulator